MSSSLKILLLEDHDALREILAQHIEQAGHRVWAAECAEALDDHMVNNSFDVLILDINLPGEDGISVAKRVRKAHPSLFIIMISVRDSLKDRVTGYESGADIYLAKPIQYEELLAALASVGRRVNHLHVQAGAVLDVKGLCLCAQKKVALNKDEVSLLKGLIEAEQHRLPHYRLLEIINQETTPSAKANLMVIIKRLRTKMMEAGIAEPGIASIHGEGYQLVATLTCA